MLITVTGAKNCTWPLRCFVKVCGAYFAPFDNCIAMWTVMRNQDYVLCA